MFGPFPAPTARRRTRQGGDKQCAVSRHHLVCLGEKREEQISPQRGLSTPLQPMESERSRLQPSREERRDRRAVGVVQRDGETERGLPACSLRHRQHRWNLSLRQQASQLVVVVKETVQTLLPWWVGHSFSEGNPERHVAARRRE